MSGNDGKKHVVTYMVDHPDQAGKRIRRRRRFASEEEAAAFLAHQEAFRRFRDELWDALDRLSGIACAMRSNHAPGHNLQLLHAEIRALYALSERGPYPVEVRKERRTAAYDRKGFTAKQRLQIIEIFNRVCQYCHRNSPSVTHDPDGADWQVDHIVPVSQGGKHARSNWTLACRSCNQRKGDLPLRIWEQSSDHPRFSRRAT